MIVRYIPADPAGNLTAIVLSPVAPQARAAVAARMMARCPEGFEQVGFAEEDSLTGEFPRLCMMGGEFCGNAARAFACYAAGVRGRGETRLSVAISGARNPVPVEIEPASRPRLRADAPALRAGQALCGRAGYSAGAHGGHRPRTAAERSAVAGVGRARAGRHAGAGCAGRALRSGRADDPVGLCARDRYARVGEQLRLGHGRAGVVSGAALCRTARTSSPSTNPAVGWRPALPWRAGAPRALKWAGRSGWARRGKSNCKGKMRLSV